MTDTLVEVKGVLIDTLGIREGAMPLTADTPLLDHLPELDSMAVVELLVRLEDRFDIRIDDGAVSSEVFGTLGTLVQFVETERTRTDE